MRRTHLASWTMVLLLMAMFTSSSSENFQGAPVTRATRIVRIALLPICNPGLSCDPTLPATINRSFFRSSFGVANFIHDVSRNNTRIVGTTLPWLRAKRRLHSAGDLIAQKDELLALARVALTKREFDVYIFYLTLGGSSLESVEVMRDATLPTKTFTFLVNTPLISIPLNQKPHSTIVPSIPWALAILRTLGVNGTSNTLHCEPHSTLGQCTVQRSRDPYSILGDMAFSLAPPSSSTRSILSRDVLPLDIANDGSYRLDAMHTSNLLVINLKTPLVLNASTRFDRIYIEQRRFSHFDRQLLRTLSKELKGPAHRVLASHQQGAFLYLGSSARQHESTLLIDANPQTASSNQSGRSAILAEFSDTSLLPGKKFKLFETPITLEVTDHNATSMTIKVAGLSQ